ncbi:D-inositol-3-phosphate glycosyltransferase [Brucella sp. NBRC 12952]|uniref:glycosyltransferase n=1 Tax=Brucella sp. NBRC 12952 TaxID=3075480 RepID=UPI0030A1E97B
MEKFVKKPEALVSCHNLIDYSGAEITVIDISKTLISLGYNVTICSFSIGEKFLSIIKDIGCNYKDISFFDSMIETKIYDLAWLHHHTTAYSLILNKRIKLNKIIYSSLSAIEPLESALITTVAVDLYLVNSKENYDYFLCHYPAYEGKVIVFENSCPEDYWSQEYESKRALNRIAIISNHIPAELLSSAEQLSQSLKVDIYGIGHKQTLITRRVLEQYDAIITIGKTVNYCLALGIPVYNYDHFGGDGWLSTKNFDTNRYFNFSGRGSRGRVTQDCIVKEIVNENLTSRHEISLLRNISKEYFCLEINVKNALEKVSITDHRMQRISITDLNATLNLTKTSIKNREIANNFQESLRLESEKRNQDALQIETLNEIIKTRDEELSLAQHELSALREKHDEELRIREIAIGNLEANNRHVQNENNALLNSTSWRITAPIRWTSKMINAIRIRFYWVKFLISRSIMVIRHQGLKEFTFRAYNYTYEWIFRKYSSFKKLFKSIPVNEERMTSTSNLPLVSFIIPVYDRTDVLREAIQSALAQSYQNIEVIIVTDGSPSETLEVVNEFKTKKNVKIFNYPTSSGNAVRGRNKGIVEADGKYISFLDSDDIATPDRIEKSLPLLERGEADVVYGAWKAILDGSRTFDDIQDGQVFYSPDTEFEALLETCVPCQSTVTLRKSLLDEFGSLQTNMEYREDHELWVRLAYNGAKFRSIPSILTSLRLHSGNNELNFKDDDSKWKKALLHNYKTIPMKPKKIAFILPGVGVSGGIAVVFKHAMMLLAAGHDAFVINIGEPGDGSWFSNNAVPIINIDDQRPYVFDHIDMLFATGWSTAEWLDKIVAKRKLYFVQSDERRFFEDEHLKKKIHNTYKLDCEYVTEAFWIQKLLSEEFGHYATYVPNGLDQNIFFPTKPLAKKSNKIRVLIEGPIIIPFKGMLDSYNAIKDLDCEIWIVSSAGQPPADWRYDRFFERVPFGLMPQIYSSCDVFLKMSRVEGFFGPPMEAMACGCSVVVGKVTGYDEYIEHQKNALVVEQGDIAGAKKAVQRLINDEDLRNQLIAEGHLTANAWSWEKSFHAMHALVNAKTKKPS